MPARRRFFVDLEDAETIVVSWKKLTGDVDKSMSSGAPSDAPVGANPALEARIEQTECLFVCCAKYI
ncbi:unnamed protein product [Sphagnum jensenii]|uniref:Uncharacterized protein n=1 Tax=Sphagnum jensenii TaxID=128206 RepID=A0ABP0W4A7_9BRYO